MAKKDDEEKPWTPDQPLDEADDEEKAQAIARARARTNYLIEQYNKPPKKKKGGWSAFSSED
jgi:hypothetical protein